MSDDPLSPIVSAYTEWFGPTSIVRSTRDAPPIHIGVVVHLPTTGEQDDPIANLTMLGTAGFGAAQICQDFACEVGIEVQGVLDEAAIMANADALVSLASVPIETSRKFEVNQILTNFSFPAFPRFTSAMLLDWDPIDGFRFPSPCDGTGLLRVLPLHPSEVEHIESFADRNEGYLSLFNRGMREADPERAPVV